MPVFIASFPNQCPALSGCLQKDNECDKDFNCPGDYICCPDDCRTRCIKPSNGTLSYFVFHWQALIDKMGLHLPAKRCLFSESHALWVLA